MNILPQLKAQVFVLSARVVQSKASQLRLSFPWLHLPVFSSFHFKISLKLHECEVEKNGFMRQ